MKRLREIKRLSMLIVAVFGIGMTAGMIGMVQNYANAYSTELSDSVIASKETTVSKNATLGGNITSIIVTPEQGVTDITLTLSGAEISKSIVVYGNLESLTIKLEGESSVENISGGKSLKITGKGTLKASNIEGIDIHIENTNVEVEGSIKAYKKLNISDSKVKAESINDMYMMVTLRSSEVASRGNARAMAMAMDVNISIKNSNVGVSSNIMGSSLYVENGEIKAAGIRISKNNMFDVLMKKSNIASANLARAMSSNDFAPSGSIIIKGVSRVDSNNIIASNKIDIQDSSKVNANIMGIGDIYLARIAVQSLGSSISGEALSNLSSQDITLLILQVLEKIHKKDEANNGILIIDGNAEVNANIIASMGSIEANGGIIKSNLIASSNEVVCDGASVSVSEYKGKGDADEEIINALLIGSIISLDKIEILSGDVNAGALLASNVDVKGGAVTANGIDEKVVAKFFVEDVEIDYLPSSAIAVFNGGAINITGGTIKVHGGKKLGNEGDMPGFGIVGLPNIDNYQNANVYSVNTAKLYISGGNIFTNGIDDGFKVAVSKDDATVPKLKVFTVNGITSEAISAIEGVVNYGIKDMKAIEGKLYLYLPEASNPTKILIGSNTYLPTANNKTVFEKYVPAPTVVYDWSPSGGQGSTTQNTGAQDQNNSPKVDTQSSDNKKNEEVEEKSSEKNVVVKEKTTGMELLKKLYALKNTKKATDKEILKWAEKFVGKKFNAKAKINLNSASKIIFNYAKINKLNMNIDKKALDNVKDSKQITKSAQNPIKWMLTKKLVKPVEKDKKQYLNPKNYLTKSDIDVIVKKLGKLK